MEHFHRLIEDCDLIDPSLANDKFTWTSLRDGMVKCRLGRFLFSRAWMEFFPALG